LETFEKSKKKKLATYELKRASLQYYQNESCQGES